MLLYFLFLIFSLLIKQSHFQILKIMNLFHFHFNHILFLFNFKKVIIKHYYD
jgi:hypothetical protein